MKTPHAGAEGMLPQMMIFWLFIFVQTKIENVLPTERGVQTKYLKVIDFSLSLIQNVHWYHRKNINEYDNKANQPP